MIALSQVRVLKVSNIFIFFFNFELMYCPGGGGSESTDRQGCAILALEVVTKNLIFA